METLNKNGVSIIQTSGEEKYVKCCIGAFRGKSIINMITAVNGNLFSILAKTFGKYYRLRDDWLKIQK